MPHIYVVGSINMDAVARVPHIPEPGETISGTEVNYYPGGKGSNQAIAAAQAGGDVSMVGAVGNDGFGSTLIDFLESKNINTKNIVQQSEHTGTAFINVDDSAENSIVVIPGANAHVARTALDSVSISTDDVIMCQLEIPIKTVTDIFVSATAQGARTVLNPAPMVELPRLLLAHTNVLILNEGELSALVDSTVDVENDDNLFAAIEKTSSLGFTGSIIVTLGSQGCLGFDENHKPVRISGYKVNAVDTTGAGDCFVGVFSAAYADGISIADCMIRATAASSLCVERHGAGPSMPTAQEINDRETDLRKAIAAQ